MRLLYPYPLLLLVTVLLLGSAPSLSWTIPQIGRTGPSRNGALERRRVATATTTALHSTPEAANGDSPTSYVRCGKCQTSYIVNADDIGGTGNGGRPRVGRRLECAMCGHSWFQSKDRLLTLRDGFELVDLPENDKNRIQLNLEQGKSPKFMGESKLYIGNVAFECHEQDIQQVFSRVGNVGDVSLVRDEEGKIRGFGFVTMRTKEEGQRAIDELDGTKVRGRNIAVRESNN